MGLDIAFSDDPSFEDNEQRTVDLLKYYLRDYRHTSYTKDKLEELAAELTKFHEDDAETSFVICTLWFYHALMIKYVIDEVSID